MTDPAQLQAALDMWTLCARATLLKAQKLGRPIPPLYTAGVRYQRERRGVEGWFLPPQIFSRGQGDCEDLATWRAAELQLRGVRARAIVYRAKPGLWHVVVQLPGGKREDPSKRLGMKGAA